MGDVVGIELDSPAGEALRVVWEPAALIGKAVRTPRDLRWRLEGELDWDAVSALRVVSAALPDGRGLGLAALRPTGAAGHGDEAIAAVLLADGAAERVSEPLLSVESAEDGPVRVGLELHTEPGAMPLRVAADVTATSREREGGVERVRAELEVRLDGKRSVGTYDVLSAGRATPR